MSTKKLIYIACIHRDIFTGEGKVRKNSASDPRGRKPHDYNRSFKGKFSSNFYFLSKRKFPSRACSSSWCSICSERILPA